MSEVVLIGMLILVGIFYCMRNQQQVAGYAAPPRVYDQFGKPIMAAHSVPMGYPAGGTYGGGYGGMSVAGSAATGFIGGILVNEVRHRSMHPTLFTPCCVLG